MRPYVYRDTRRRPDGERPWCIGYMGLDEKFHRQRTQAPTKTMAKALLDRRVREIEEARAGGFQAVTPCTVKEFAPVYVTHCVAHNKPKQVKRASGILRNHLLPEFGSVRLDQLTTGMIQDYIDHRLNEPGRKGKRTAPSTAHNELMTLSGLYREGIKRQRARYNPCRGVRLPKIKNERHRYVTLEEEARLLEASPERLRVFIRAMLQTALRLDDLRSLNWANVDLSRMRIRVGADQTKGHDAVEVPITTEMAAILSSQGPHIDPTRPVFVNTFTGRRWTSVDQLFKRATERAGLSDVTLHTLRHTAASRMVQRGVPIVVVSKILGHASIRTTMRYAHLAPDDIDRGAEALAYYADRATDRRSEEQSPSVTTHLLLKAPISRIG